MKVRVGWHDIGVLKHALDEGLLGRHNPVLGRFFKAYPKAVVFLRLESALEASSIGEMPKHAHSADSRLLVCCNRGYDLEVMDSRKGFRRHDLEDPIRRYVFVSIDWKVRLREHDFESTTSKA